MSTWRGAPTRIRAGLRVLREGIAGLYPGYFALVMATGILSIAAHLLGLAGIARPLLWINIVCSVALAALLLARIAFFFPLVVRDLTDHARGPGFFTVVAGTCVLGNQIVLLRRDLYLGSILWVVGSVLWFALMYGFLTAVTVRVRKPTFVAAINGSWLIAIVATQSVAVLGSAVAEVLRPWSEVALFVSLAMHLAGALLYLLVITLIFYRLTFFRLDAQTLAPPYWINMGAVAITTLAGAALILRAGESALLTELAPFLTGSTVFFWSIATWWIPLLLFLGAWRHLYRRVSLRYEPQYWGMVFPLGMYSAATFRLADAARLEFILPVAYAFFYIALFAWLLAFAGLLHRLLATARGRVPAATPVPVLAAVGSMDGRHGDGGRGRVGRGGRAASGTPADSGGAAGGAAGLADEPGTNSSLRIVRRGPDSLLERKAGVLPMPERENAVIPPPSFRRFATRYPAVVEAYERFGAELRAAGPLSAREVALVKLAVSVGARSQGGTYAHVRKARAAGLADADLEHVVLLAAPTVGFPSMMAALGWLRDAASGAAGETRPEPGPPRS